MSLCCPLVVSNACWVMSFFSFHDKKRKQTPFCGGFCLHNKQHCLMSSLNPHVIGPWFKKEQPSLRGKPMTAEEGSTSHHSHFVYLQCESHPIRLWRVVIMQYEFLHPPSYIGIKKSDCVCKNVIMLSWCSVIIFSYHIWHGKPWDM